MVPNQQLSFLQEKIQEIGSAIFFNLSDSVLKLPTSIVTTLKVDDFGYVWFYVKKPQQHLREFENEFPVRLDYFKKGKDCFLQVIGKGWVVADPEEMNVLGDIFSPELMRLAKDNVLVKVKIVKAEYRESRTAHQNSWWQNAMNSVITWFRNSNQYRTENTYFPASDLNYNV